MFWLLKIYVAFLRIFVKLLSVCHIKKGWQTFGIHKVNVPFPTLGCLGSWAPSSRITSTCNTVFSQLRVLARPPGTLHSRAHLLGLLVMSLTPLALHPKQYLLVNKLVTWFPKINSLEKSPWMPVVNREPEWMHYKLPQFSSWSIFYPYNVVHLQITVIT